MSSAISQMSNNETAELWWRDKVSGKVPDCTTCWEPNSTILSNQKGKNLDFFNFFFSPSCAPSLPAWCQLLGHSVVAWRGFPLCHRSPGMGRRQRRCHHPVPQQIMDTESRLLHWEPEARLFNRGPAASLCPYITAVERTSVAKGDVSVMNCETAMRRGIMLQAWVVRSAEWRLLTVVTQHNDELSWLSGPFFCGRETKKWYYETFFCLIQTRIHNKKDDAWLMMREVRNDGPEEVYMSNTSSFFFPFHLQVLSLYVTVC